MAPQPEYDKEPKAPDKSITNNSCEDSKIPHNVVNDQQTLSDNKPASSAASVETEKEDKHVEALDDGQLRALLDEAITYKCPKDREGKSNLFKELLEEVEQDEQACEAAARVWGAGRRGGRGARRRALPHSNSLQDLVAALAAEPVRRRVQPAPPVSARTLHGGSLPSGVDTSFLLSEEPRMCRGVEYVATVHCENPSPLNERRVSTSDCPENELTNRRSKLSAFPMTYTARATLEIGSGSVGSGRAVTTTTASNQVSLSRPPRSRHSRTNTTAPHAKVSGGETKPRGPEDCKTDTGKTHKTDKNKSVKSGNKKVDNHEHKITILKRGTELKTVKEMQNVIADVTTMAKNDEKVIVNSKNDMDCESKSNENPKESKKNKNRIKKHRSRSNNAVETKDLAHAVKIDTQEKSTPNISDASNAKKKQNKSKRNKSTPRMPSAPDPQYDLKWYQAQMEASNHYSDAQSEQLYNAEILNANRPPTCGPPEKIFKNTISKHKLYPQINSLDSPDRTRPIIYFENSKLGCSLRKKAPCANASSNNKNYSRNKDFKANHSKPVDESTPLISSGSESDILKRIHSKNIVPSSLVNVNPTNVRPMTIGSPVHILSGDNKDKANDNDKITKDNHNVPNFTAGAGDNKSQITTGSTLSDKEVPRHDILHVSKSPEKFNVAVQNAEVKIEIHENLDSSIEGGSLNESTNSESQQIYTLVENNGTVQYIQPQGVFQMSDENSEPISGIYCIELNDIAPNQGAGGGDSKNLAYFADQVQLFEVLKNANETTVDKKISNICDKEQSDGCEEKSSTCDNKPTSSNDDETHSAASPVNAESIGKEICKVREAVDSATVSVSDSSRAVADLSSVQQSSLREFFNNVYYFLTLPEGLLTPNVTSIKDSASQKILELSNRANEKKAEQTELENKEKQEEATVTKSKKSKKNKKARLKDASENSPERGSANKQVDSGIPFSCITSPEVVSSCSTTSSAPQSAVAVDAKPRNVSTSSFNGLPLSRPGHYGATGTTSTDEFKKSLDENGNSVPGLTSPLSGAGQHKKLRRKKSSKNEVVIKSHQIDGYKGDKDLNEVLRFIESSAERRGKLPAARAKHDDEKKKRRKDKPGTGPQRATSLEELSRCEPHALRHRRAPPPPAAPRRSWGDDAAYYPPASPPPPAPLAPAAKKKPKGKLEAAPADPPADTTLELLDFQTVTKKKKPRKRFEEGEGGGDVERPPASSPPRRKSAPPSDKSNDSNDDMDSVHSLPADPRAPRPPASYADIARQRHNIPDLIESCNFYGEEAAAAPVYDADSYPALPPAAPGKQPDVVAARPAVVLRDEAAADLHGVTFGFDVNETLLRAGRRRCDLLQDVSRAAPRYVPPPPPHPRLLRLRTALADYVGCAWEDIMKLGSAKVRYYAE